MPYISKQARMDLQSDHYAVQTAGELNYVITQAVLAYLDSGGEARYSSLNTAIGVLECAKLELYRRVGVVVEERAIGRNGDLQAYDDLLNYERTD